MEDEEGSQLCARCSTRCVADSNKTVTFCTACAVDGCAPPLVSEYRTTCDANSCDSVEVAQGMLLADNSYVAPTRGMLDDAPQSVDSQATNTVVDGNQLTDCQSGPSSMERLQKQMEMLTHDEDISVHCIVTAEDDGTICCQSEVDKIDSEDITTHSFDPAAVLRSQHIDDENDDGNVLSVHPATRHKTQQQLVGSDTATCLATATELAHQRRRKCSGKDQTDCSAESDGLHCDCCSVLTHKKTQIDSATSIVDSKSALTLAGWLVQCLLLLLLLLLLLAVVCSVKPAWCRLGLLVDWRLRHIGGSPPV